jgi:hypothetical protein
LFVAAVVVVVVVVVVVAAAAAAAAVFMTQSFGLFTARLPVPRKICFA